MTITLELPAELETRLIAEARIQGLPITEVVKAHLFNQVPPPPVQLTPEDLDKAFEEIAGFFDKHLRK